MYGQYMEKEKKTVVPNVYEQQIILTCKGYNKNEDSIEAIRNILSQQFGLRTKYIYDSIIYRWLIKIVKNYSDYNYIIDDFLYGLFDKKSEITVIEAIKDLISILANIMVINKDGQELIRLEKNEEILNWVAK